MFLTGGVLVMALVLLLKANDIYARSREVLVFSVEILEGEFIAAGVCERKTNNHDENQCPLSGQNVL